MFRHRRGLFRRRRRSELIDRLWNCRLLPTTAVASSRLYQDSVVDRDRTDEVSPPAVGLTTNSGAVGAAGQRSTSSGTALRDRCGNIGNGIQRYCSCFGVCWKSSLPASRLDNEDDNDDCRPEAGDSDDKRIFDEMCRTASHTKIMKREAERLLFDLIDIKQLETLVEVVCGRLCDDDGQAGGCILVPLRCDAGGTAPHVVSCGLWRWPEAVAGDDSVPLKPMPYCASATGWNLALDDDGEPSVICCNPYHWSRTLQLPTDISFQRDSSSKDKELVGNDVTRLSSPVDSAPGVVGVTSGTSTRSDSVSCPTDSSWCTLAYWEHDRRVGPLYPVRDRRVEIFDRLARGTGLCLGLLDNSQANEHHQVFAPKSRHSFSSISASGSRRRRTADSVRHTREKIGPGLVLSLEQGSTVDNGLDSDDYGCECRNTTAWIYNRSRYPVFVSRQTSSAGTTATNVDERIGLSRTDVAATATTIEKLPPGFAMKLFEDVCDRWRRLAENDEDVTRRERTMTGCCRRTMSDSRRCAQISFVKGWGSGYHRTCVTSCPCWIEVLIDVDHR